MKSTDQSNFPHRAGPPQLWLFCRQCLGESAVGPQVLVVDGPDGAYAWITCTGCGYEYRLAGPAAKALYAHPRSTHISYTDSLMYQTLLDPDFYWPRPGDLMREWALTDAAPDPVLIEGDQP